jgi:hypothetical protein
VRLLSGRARRWLRRLLDWMTDRLSDGPEPPPRLALEVAMFRRHSPNADHGRWSEFAAKLARNSYRDGFQRGLEWAERDWTLDSKDPEQLMEAAAQDWTLPEAQVRFDRLLDLLDPYDGGLSPEDQERVRAAIQSGLPVHLRRDDEPRRE